jgi:hypothetical protein
LMDGCVVSLIGDDASMLPNIATTPPSDISRDPRIVSY